MRDITKLPIRDLTIEEIDRLIGAHIKSVHLLEDRKEELMREQRQSVSVLAEDRPKTEPPDALLL